MEKRFRVCENAPKNVEDTKTGEAFLCYNTDVAQELAEYLNQQFPENELFKLTLIELTEAKLYTLQKMRIKQAEIIELEQNIKDNENQLWLSTDFKAEGCTNDTMRKSFVNHHLKDDKDQLQWLKFDYRKFEDDLEIINTLLEVKTE